MIVSMHQRWLWLSVAFALFLYGSCSTDISCNDGEYKNGVGFMPHPTDCRFFIQCLNNGASYVIKQCREGLYWNQENLVRTFPSDSNCKTTATVAPVSPMMSTTSSSTSTATLCSKRSVPGKSNVYKTKVPGFGWLELPCAPGTVFDQAACNCIDGTSTIPPAACRDDMYLPLTKDIKDHSVFRWHVDNTGVSIDKDGYARFGDNSTLGVPRFANFDFGNTLRISFILRNIPSAGQAEAVVSNAACGHPGSIYITRTPSTVEFSVVNQDDVVSTLSVPMTSVLSSIGLEVYDGTVTGNVSGVIKNATFKGQIKKVHCGLQIGSATGLQNFTGRLKEFKLALCKP